jgi:hypothetical protein
MNLASNTKAVPTRQKPLADILGPIQQESAGIALLIGLLDNPAIETTNKQCLYESRYL